MKRRAFDPRKRNGSQPRPPALTEKDILSEEDLARIEAEPGLQQMARDSARAVREGRVFRHEDVMAALRARGRRRVSVKQMLLERQQRNG
jgi:hypothetical protein